jgi:hypothetical protein
MNVTSYGLNMPMAIAHAADVNATETKRIADETAIC